MAGETKTVKVFNAAKGIITVRGCIRKKRDEKVSSKNFKVAFAAGAVTSVPEAYVQVFKRNEIFNFYVDTQVLIIGKGATSAYDKANAEPETIKKLTPGAAASQVQQSAILDALENEEEEGEGEGDA